MDNIGQLRVFVAEDFFPIFHEISRNKLFTQNSEFFIFCTFVGEKENHKVTLNKRHELCRAVTLTKYDQTAIKALYLKEYGRLSSFKDIVEHAEEWANGGIEYLLKNILVNVVTQAPTGSWSIKRGMQAELQLILLKYVLMIKQEAPF